MSEDACKLANAHQACAVLDWFLDNDAELRTAPITRGSYFVGWWAHMQHGLRDNG